MRVTDASAIAVGTPLFYAYVGDRDIPPVRRYQLVDEYEVGTYEIPPIARWAIAQSTIASGWYTTEDEALEHVKHGAPLPEPVRSGSRRRRTIELGYDVEILEPGRAEKCVQCGGTRREGMLHSCATGENAPLLASDPRAEGLIEETGVIVVDRGFLQPSGELRLF